MEFRGEEADVRRIQSKYASYFLGRRNVLDIGCGRGEFLTLLRANGIPASGVEASADLAERVRRMGFTVAEMDARAFLRGKSDAFDGIFCSHVIEHLSPDAVFDLVSLFHEALVDGGALVIVTPNPENVHVMTELFWLDVSHVRPYPLALLREIVRTRGFALEASGDDPDTALRGPLSALLRPIVGALRSGARLGRLFLSGEDLFLVARCEKPRARPTASPSP